MRRQRFQGLIAMAEVILKNIKKIYPHQEPKKKKKGEPEKKTNLQITEEGVLAVDNFNLHIQDKEFIVLVGPSGCGKSTTLRMVAGLEEISKGEMYIGGRLINDVPPKDRDIAMVFQSYALYPHMTVYKNIAFGLELRKTPKDEIDKRVHEAAKILEIEHLLDRKPKALSGGQRQRVCIARGILSHPDLLICDEIVSALDPTVQVQVLLTLHRLQQERRFAMFFISHDLDVVEHISTKIAVVYRGSIVEYGPAEAVMNRPQHPYTQKLIEANRMASTRA
mgnify:CR=1 FL=1